jgi:sporulation protein YlmC with PRC-barrel domain
MSPHLKHTPRRLAVLLIAAMSWHPLIPASARATDDALTSLQAAREELAQLGTVLSAQWLLGMRAYGRAGDIAAEVADVIIGDHGALTSAILHVRSIGAARGGLFNIPWRHIEFTSDYAHVLVPLSEHNANGYRMRREQLATKERRLTLMLRGRVALNKGVQYGTIDDLVLTEQGEIRAIVIAPSPYINRGEQYALPYRHDRYREGIYHLPYRYSDAQRLAFPELDMLQITPAPRFAVRQTARDAVRAQRRYHSGFPVQ